MSLPSTWRWLCYLVGLCLFLTLACAQAGQVVTPAVGPAATQAFLLAEYVPAYDPGATPDFPPDYSLSSRIWPDGIPATPIAVTPQFVDHPELTPILKEVAPNDAGCKMLAGFYIVCAPTSPLNAFDCDELWSATNRVELVDSFSVVALCRREVEQGRPIEPALIHRVGCLSRTDIGYILKIENRYELVLNQARLQTLLTPIETPAEALAYARMYTGLSAKYTFREEPGRWDTLVYFEPVIEDTYVIAIDAGYELLLYHVAHCGCGSWLTTAITVIVTHDGTVSLTEFAPVYLVIDHSLCVD